MNIPILCLFLAGLLLVLSKLPVGLAMKRKGYDNKNPRDQQASLEGWGKRAVAAHANHFEAFPLYAAGVLTSQWVGLQNTYVSSLCVLFILCRVFYNIFYISDWDKMRSVVWMTGYISSLLLICTGFYHF